MSEPKAQRPRPDPTGDTRGYWEGARRHQLVLQRCLACSAYRHDPRPMCPECHSLEFEWASVSGRGRVYSYAIVHQPLHPFWLDQMPYNVVLVELEEGIRLISNLVDCANEEISIGMPVSVCFEDLSEEISLPMFRPETPSGAAKAR
jgi:uncharacterized OB-fold protein